MRCLCYNTKCFALIAISRDNTDINLKIIVFEDKYKKNVNI
jgi:hypothetical protein